MAKLADFPAGGFGTDFAPRIGQDMMFDDGPKRVAIAADGSALFFAAPYQTPTNRLSNAGTMRVYPLGIRPVVTGLGETIAPGRPVSVTITIRDAAGNVVTDFVGDVSLRSNNAGDTLPATLTFSPADAGTKMLEVTFAPRTGEPNRPTSNFLTATVAATGASAGVDGFSIDNSKPTAAFVWNGIINTPNGRSVTVRYSDNEKVDQSTLDDDDVYVRTPTGGTIPARLVEIKPSQYGSNTKDVEVVYMFDGPGPGISTDHAYVGEYQVVVRPDEVKDNVGNSLAGEVTLPYAITYQAPPPPQADLAISKLSVSGLRGSRTTGGSWVTAKFTVRNVGKTAVEATDVDVFVGEDGDYFDDELESSTRYVPLKPGASKTFTARVQLPHYDDYSGMFRLTVIVGEADEGLEEDNQENNLAESKAFRVNPLTGPITPLQPTSPVTLLPGSVQTVTLRARNDREWALKGQYQLNVLATTDGTLGTEEATLLSVIETLSFRPGQVKSLKLQIVVPHTLPAGDYLLLLDPLYFEAGWNGEGGGGGSGGIVTGVGSVGNSST